MQINYPAASGRGIRRATIVDLRAVSDISSLDFLHIRRWYFHFHACRPYLHSNRPSKIRRPTTSSSLRGSAWISLVPWDSLSSLQSCSHDMSVQTEPKNEHDPHQCQSPRTLPDTVSQYPNTPPSEPHPHDHQILHVYTWQAIHNGISISLHYDSCGCICSPAYFTPQAAGNTTLRDLTLTMEPN